MSRAPNEVVPGPIARNVVENVIRLRKSLHLTKEALSTELANLGRPIRATGLARLEAGNRRVDADDLVALAMAFKVSPITLLLPYTATGDIQLSEKVETYAVAAWEWMRALRPLDLPETQEDADALGVDFMRRSLPMGARGDHSRASDFFTRLHEQPIRPDGPAVRPDSYFDLGEEGDDGQHREAT